MIDDEVRADVAAALELAATAEIEGGALDGVDWSVDLERPVDLHPAWAEEDLLPAPVRARLCIARSDLLAVATECRRARTWAPLLAAADAWVLGTSAHGVGRTRRLLGGTDVEGRLEAAVSTLEGAGPIDAYYLLNNDGHLHGWGPALFSHFLAAADLRVADGALGLDETLAGAVNGLVPGSDLGPNDWSTAEYAFFLGLMHRIAREVGVPPAVVAAALAEKYAD